MLNINPGESFFGFFGGSKKFDCWMTVTADILSNPGDPRVKPIKLDNSIFPSQIQGIMNVPHEALDLIMGNLELIKAWKYTLRYEGKEIQIIDEVSGHVVEIGNEFELRKKYGIVNDN